MTFRDSQEHRLWAMTLNGRLHLLLSGYVTWAGDFTLLSLSFRLCQTNNTSRTGSWGHSVTWCRQNHCWPWLLWRSCLLLIGFVLQNLRLSQLKGSISKTEIGNNTHNGSKGFSWHEVMALNDLHGALLQERVPKPGERVNEHLAIHPTGFTEPVDGQWVSLQMEQEFSTPPKCPTRLIHSCSHLSPVDISVCDFWSDAVVFFPDIF